MFQTLMSQTLNVFFVVLAVVFVIGLIILGLNPRMRPALAPAVVPVDDADDRVPDRRQQCLERVEAHLKLKRRYPPMSARTIQRHLNKLGAGISRTEVWDALRTLITNHHTVVVNRSRRGRLLYAAR